jgi:hypothetical protein
MYILLLGYDLFSSGGGGGTITQAQVLACVRARIESFQQFSNSNTNFYSILMMKSSSFLVHSCPSGINRPTVPTRPTQNNCSGADPECRIVIGQSEDMGGAVKVRKWPQSRQRPKTPVKKLRGAVDRARKKKKRCVNHFTQSFLNGVGIFLMHE